MPVIIRSSFRSLSWYIFVERDRVNYFRSAGRKVPAFTSSSEKMTSALPLHVLDFSFSPPIFTTNTINDVEKNYFWILAAVFDTLYT